jgi:hypothetical protein
MTRYEIAQHLANMKYKPGVTFGVRQGYGLDVLEIWIQAYVDDALYVPSPANPNYPKIPLRLAECVPPYVVTLAALKEFMRYLFRKLENHEVDEWFKYDGECVTDPHPEFKYGDLGDDSSTTATTNRSR